jgi:hypothetical protein
MNRFLLVMLLAACGSKKPASSPDASPAARAAPPDATSPDAAPADAGPLRLGEREVEIEWHDHKARLRAFMPTDWIASHGAGSFRPAQEYPLWYPLISFAFGGYSCQGECKDSDFERERDALLGRALESAARPNFGTGRPELDAVRLEITELDKGALPGGGYVAWRVRRPANLAKEVDGPYFEGIEALCARFRKGDDFYIHVSVRIPRSDEERYWPLLLDACRQSEVMPPPPIAEREVVLRRRQQELTVRAWMPAGFVAAGEGSFAAKADEPSPKITFAVTDCPAECTAADVETLRARALEAAKTPDPARPDVTASVSDVEKGSLPGGAFAAWRVQKYYATEGTHFEGFEAFCVRGRKGDPFLLTVNVRIPTADKTIYQAALLEGCRRSELE